MLKTFTYMFDDNGFWKNFGFLYIIVLIANLLINYSGIFSPGLNNGKIIPLYYILFILGFFVMFIPYGYSISLLKTTLKKNDSEELPVPQIIKNFVDGFKVVVAGSLLVILLGVFLYLVTSFGNLLAYVHPVFANIVTSALVILTLLSVTFLGIGMCCRYVVKPSFLNFIDFNSTVRFVNKCNVSKYFISYVLSIFVLLVTYAISMIIVSFLTKIGYTGLVIYCIIVSLLWTYQIYVFAGLFSQAVDAEKIV